jgi:hypothetical protein
MMPRTDPYDRVHLGSGARQNYRRRQAAEHCQTIALVGLQLVALDDEAVSPNGIS